MANQARFFSRLAALIAMVVLTGLVAVGQSSAVRLVTQKVDESKLTTLAGHVHPAANALNDRGPVDDSAPVGHVALLLRRSAAQQLDLDALVDQLHNPKSENYHKWLTPESFGRRFGPADEDVAAVASWLQSKGFTIEDMPASKTHITFTGTVGQMRDAFHIDVHHLSVNGQAHQSTMNEPQIPSALAPVVSGFRQLNDFGPKPANHFAGVFKKDLKTGKLTPAEGTAAAPRADFTNTYNSQTFYDVGPQDFYTIYNETPLLSAGTNGAGVTIAVIEQTQINAADPVSFRSQFGLATYPATPTSAAGGINYIYGGTPAVGSDAACTAPLSVTAGMASGDEGEADIDVEWAGTAAPNATIDFVACGTTANAIGSFGTDLAAEHIANYLSNSVTAASLSYGECQVDSGNTTFYTDLWEQYAAQGQTAVVSSGDGGSMGCEMLTNQPSVNVMSATAYNISAGGTDFGDAYISNGYATSPATTWWSATNGTGLSSALSYVPETAWGGYCSNPLFVSLYQNAGNPTFGTTYTPEAFCNNATAVADGLRATVGGGGGPSSYGTLPTWQNVYGIGLYSSSTTRRNQPDISLFAGNGLWGHALPFCESDEYTCDYATSPSDAYQLEAGGTSFVAPQIAGIIALVNQATGQAQGQADYTLYALAAQEYGTSGSPAAGLSTCSGSNPGPGLSSCIFQDIAADTPSLQTGSIASGIIEPCKYSSVTHCYRTVTGDAYGLSAIGGSAHSPTLAYSAGAGYDLATGLGSVNIANLINSWKTSGISFASTTTLAVSPTPVAWSLSPTETLTATVKATGRGGKVAPGGTVQFFSGGSTAGPSLGTASIVPNCTGAGSATSCDGIATLAVAPSTLEPGANSIVASFEGDAANDAPSTSTAKTVTVNSWPQTITITSVSTGTYGTPLTVTATSDSGLTAFTFSVVSGPATITASGGVLTFTGVAPVTVQVNQAGNATYAAALAQQTITVLAATPTLTVASSVNPSTYGGSVTFTATMSSGPTGTVTFLDGATAIGTGTLSGAGIATYVTTTLTAGTHTITASWPGNGDYNPVTSSNSVSQVVNQATPTITWATPAAITYGTALSSTQLDASSTVDGTFAYTPAAGQVLDAGSQTLSVLFTPTDTTDYSTATKTVKLTVHKATPTIAWATPAPVPYDTVLSATQLDAIASWIVGGSPVDLTTAGTFTYTPAAGKVLTTLGENALSVTFVPSDTTDYNHATATVDLNVVQATPVITWPTPAPISDGTPLSGTQLDATAANAAGANLAGVFVYSPGSGTVLTVGSQTLSVTFTPTSPDYATVTQSVTLQVNPVLPALITPTPGSVLGTSNVTFSWTPGIGVSQYMLWLGTTGVDSRNIFESGALTANSVIVPSLPGSFPSGVTVYATLVSCINGQWLTADYVHYTFTETQGVLAVLNTPTPGSVLGTTGVTFSWSPGTAVTKYALYLGTTGIGSANRFESAALTGNSVIVPSLPAGYPSGGIVYARLLSFIGGSWYSADYTYTETQGVLAALTTPIPGPATVLGTTNVTFSWSPGIGVTQYALYLGTTGVGSANRFESAGMTATNVTVPSLPAGYPSGGIVYARLWSNIGGAWYSADYTYTETQGALAVLNTPTPGSVLGTTGVYFSWSPGTAVTQYALYLGTTGVGSADRFESAGMTATNVTVPSLPANGATVYARLWSNIGGSWYSADYTYTEQQ